MAVAVCRDVTSVKARHITHASIKQGHRFLNGALTACSAAVHKVHSYVSLAETNLGRQFMLMPIIVLRMHLPSIMNCVMTNEIKLV